MRGPRRMGTMTFEPLGAGRAGAGHLADDLGIGIVKVAVVVVVAADVAGLLGAFLLFLVRLE